MIFLCCLNTLPILHIACILYHLHSIHNKITFHIISILSPITWLVTFAKHKYIIYFVFYSVIYAISAFSICSQWYCCWERNKILYNFIQRFMSAAFTQNKAWPRDKFIEIHGRLCWLGKCFCPSSYLVAEWLYQLLSVCYNMLVVHIWNNWCSHQKM